jgi:hypothetical protein
MHNPFAQPRVRPPEELFLEAVGDVFTDKAAAGAAGWTAAQVEAYVQSHANAYEVADNKRQYKYESIMMATGRGSDAARVALRNETKSWQAKAEAAPTETIEDLLA